MTDKDKRCGTEVDWPTNFIVPHATLMPIHAREADADCYCPEGAEAECVDILCPRKTLEGRPMPIAVVIRPGVVAGSFLHDLATSMIGVGHGYDPYNHVGYFIVCELIGVPI